MRELSIGDLVIRAYAWHSIIPGIIIDKEIEIIGEASSEFESYNFVVMWSDGSNTKEMYEELDRLDDIEEMINEYW